MKNDSERCRFTFSFIFSYPTQINLTHNLGQKKTIKAELCIFNFFNHLRSLGSWRELELIPAATERDGENPQQVASPSQS